MDIEQLTKSQIMLLTLLVSFMTSIATGIVTVSLMDQAPPAIAQTVNRVVERTVERVVPSETQLATVVTKEKTVVVKESELIPAAVARVQPSLARIFKKKGDEYVFAGYGIAVTPTTIVVPSGLVGEKDDALAEAVGGARAPISVMSSAKKESSLALVSVMPSKVNPEETPAKFSSAALGVDSLKLGQTVVALFGTKGIQVASGIVTALGSDDQAGTFTTDIASSGLVSGAVLVNTDGVVVGMYAKSSDSFLSAGLISALLKDVSTQASSATSTAATQ